MNRSKRSIKQQYSLIFGALLLVAILLISFINIATLGRFYTYHKEKVLLATYDAIDKVVSAGEIDSEDFEDTLNKIVSINNIEVLILDSDTQTIVCSNKDSRVLTSRLLEYIFVGVDNANTVYEDAKVHIQTQRDPRLNLDYLELWGELSSNNLIFMRSPVQSMKEASAIANQNLLIVGFIISAAGFCVIWFVSKTLTKPIMNLVNISEKITKLDFSEKYTTNMGNEIDILGEHINSLSDNLERTIIELKNANAQLQTDIDKKNEIDEMRKEFISNVSHELKTPIALIQGYAEGLKDCVIEDEESREFYCDVIIDESARMNKIVRNLLDLSEIEFGHNKVEMAHFDMVELINNCAQSFDIMIKGENISLELPNMDDKVLVWADEFMVERVFNNYLSNAIHYAKNDKIVRVLLENKEDVVRVRVFNSGDVIPDDVIPFLWTKFYKADKARTREYGGSGIGLSIVKASMDALGHHYGVINHEDGVEFWFEVDSNQVID